eukprot:CAMPEP_0117044948 /NCGR_PEP_ID=MMETSP0472-20121206/31122_1 /TAXON_ID=693140 ORGANISM="Tiarina fusus, Strain LIS" /NCGR_SAMPLE_ID=MMETSP0472 /ASSEMBLY_ACC=CAM_ASM_000603 /LENGTH=129 /DNA_ID=CAMNT_0004756815 /DNA_START=66 /DNA_END=455 /DNA_ORIENTATION=+
MFRSLVSSAFRVSAAQLNKPQQTLWFSTSTGTVKWFDTKKGFGFITPDEGGGDVFVHQTAIHAEGFRSLAEGEPVEFSVITDDKGKTKADSVTGPMGAFVQGAPPPRPRVFHNNDFGSNDFGFDDEERR